MINLNTPNKELLEELKRDYAKADYWLEKKTGGPRKVEELRQTLLHDYHRTGKHQVSEPVEYISPNGNRWLMYYRTQKVGRYTVPLSSGFCYYETLGSIGAYILMGSTSATVMDSVIIFPSHFFQRLDEKLGLGVRSRAVVKRFMEMIDNMVIEYKGDSDKRRDEVEVSFFDSVWRGRYRNGDNHIIELNTFIPHKNLSSKEQLRKAKRLQEIQKTHIPNSQETDYHDLEYGDAEAWVQRLLDNVNGAKVRNQVTHSYFYLYNLTKMTADELGMKMDAGTFDALLLGESRGENHLGLLKLIYQLSYKLIPDDSFALKVGAGVFVTLRRQGYTGTLDDLEPALDTAVRKYNDWLEKRKDAFEKHYKRPR